MAEISTLVYALRCVPVLTIEPTELGAAWLWPVGFDDHLEKICRCPKLVKRIVKVCQQLLDTRVFAGLTAITVSFSSEGVGFNIQPGQECGLAPTCMGYSDHNTDYPWQAFVLHALLGLMINEILPFVNEWEENPDFRFSEPIEKDYFLEPS